MERVDAKLSRPSGMMCTHCKKSKEDCSRIEFSGFRVMKVDNDGTNVVICKELEKENK